MIGKNGNNHKSSRLFLAYKKVFSGKIFSQKILKENWKTGKLSLENENFSHWKCKDIYVSAFQP
jgi:hypothetical protein